MRDTSTAGTPEPSLLARRSAAIGELCARARVRRLEVFGSGASGDPPGAGSDLDFIVHFDDPGDLGPWMARYFDLHEALRSLLGVPVDLVLSTSPCLSDPDFAREAARTRRVIYDREDAEVPA